MAKVRTQGTKEQIFRVRGPREVLEFQSLHVQETDLAAEVIQGEELRASKAVFKGWDITDGQVTGQWPRA